LARARLAHEQAHAIAVGVSDIFDPPADRSVGVPNLEQEPAEFNREFPPRSRQVEKLRAFLKQYWMAERFEEVYRSPAKGFEFVLLTRTRHIAPPSRPVAE